MDAEETQQKRRSRKDRMREILLENLLIILMIIAVIVGICLGIGMRSIWTPYDKRKLHYLRFPGDLLMNMLKMLILPLIISSLISSLAFLDAKASGRMGLRAVVYYMLTTFFAVILGIIMVLAISPGTKGSSISKSGSAKESEPLDALFDLIRYRQYKLISRKIDLYLLRPISWSLFLLCFFRGWGVVFIKECFEVNSRLSSTGYTKWTLFRETIQINEFHVFNVHVFILYLLKTFKPLSRNWKLWKNITCKTSDVSAACRHFSLLYMYIKVFTFLSLHEDRFYMSIFHLDLIMNILC